MHEENANNQGVYFDDVHIMEDVAVTDVVHMVRLLPC